MKTIFYSSPYAIDLFSEKKRKTFRHGDCQISVSITSGFFELFRKEIRLLDVSIDGAGICCEVFFPLNTTLPLQLKFSDESIYLIKGKVTRIQKQTLDNISNGKISRLFKKTPRLYYYGLQFETRSHEFEERLIQMSLRKKLRQAQ